MEKQYLPVREIQRKRERESELRNMYVPEYRSYPIAVLLKTANFIPDRPRMEYCTI